MENKEKLLTNQNLMGIFGTNRSGSSWLGSILNTHPQVAYRFEPFHRLKEYPAFCEARELLESEQLTESDLAKVYKILLPARPKIDRPPFFPKIHEMTWGKTWLRPAGLQFKSLGYLFKKLYSPRNTPPLVFKEVTMEPMMQNLLARTTMKVVYLVRHPCGVVASTIKGQRAGVMPVGRHSVLDKLLIKHDPALAESLTTRWNQLGALDKETLLWRLDVEKGIAAAKSHPNALIVIYEDLCQRPEELTRQVFEHFKLDLTAQTLSFLENLSREKQPRGWREIGINSYFSVVRNPAAMKNKWKQQMSAVDQQRVLGWVADSEAFQYCANLGRWD